MRPLNIPSRLRPWLIAAGLILLLAGVAAAWRSGSAPTPGEAPSAGCIPDPAVFLAMDLAAFDQGPSGWRRFETMLGCEAETADLIRAYRDAHSGRLTPGQATSLYWHEGQLRAAAGDTEAAASLMEQSVFAGEDRWSVLYKTATVAFLRRDRAALERARADLAALSPSELRVGNATQAEAPNLARVDGLIACFDRPYAVAYTCTVDASTARSPASDAPTD